MEQTDADIMCFGHTHKPYHKVLSSFPDGVARYYHAINIGSIGKPKDGDPRGCYVILTINYNSSISDKENIHAEHIRFEYDVEKAAKAIEESPLPK